MAKPFFLDRRPHRGISYDEYMKRFQEKVDHTDPDTLDEQARQLWEYTQLNLQRSQRVWKTYRPSPELKDVVQRLSRPQLWMVLTEDWCGDSAQLLPIIAKIASLSDNITLKILYRDENPDIMDQYLTNGKRGVPKLVAFSRAGEELFTWGPRPREAQRIFDEGVAAGLPKTEIYPKLQLWYSKDRGKTTEAELMELLRQHASSH